MSQHITNPEAIRAMKPLLDAIAGDLAEAYDAAADLLTSEGAGAADPTLDEALERAQACADEFERLGATVASYGPIAVEFIAEVHGEIGYMRWQHGARGPGQFRSTESLCREAVAVA